MAECKIKLPVELTLVAEEKSVRFMPYKENFVTTIQKGKALVITVDTVGQYLYYEKLGFKAGVVVAEDVPVVEVKVPVVIKLTNNSTVSQYFTPYRENFQYEIKSGDAVSFKADRTGQVLYYLAQDTSGADVAGGLDVNKDYAIDVWAKEDDATAGTGDAE